MLLYILGLASRLVGLVSTARPQVRDVRAGAFLFAVERVAESYKHHGIFP